MQTVLIIEDDPICRRLLEVLLLRSGYEAVTAGCCEEGIRAIGEHRPQWVLLDLNLPDGHGAAVLRHCDRERIKCNVIVATGADEETIRQCQPFPAAAILRKPLDLDRLLAVMSREDLAETRSAYEAVLKK